MRLLWRPPAATRQARAHRDRIYGYQISTAKPAIATVGLFASYLAGEALGLRNTLPGPLDIADHISNTTLAPFTALGWGAMYELMKTKNRLPHFLTRDEIKKFRRRSVPAFMALTATAHTLIETSLGTQPTSFLPANTPDSLDIAYATVAAGISGVLGWRKKPMGIAIPSHNSPQTRKPF